MPNITQKVNKETNKFTYGLITTLENDSIPAGAAQQGTTNWITKGDRIELRRGSRFLGTSSVNTGVGKTSGLRKVVLADGTERLFGTYGKKIKYFDEVTDEWIEIGSDLLGDDVVDEDGLSSESVSMEEYVGLAGNQLFINSKNCSGFYKIMVANPTDYTNMYNVATNFKGLIKIDSNRTILWQTKKDQTGIYGSYIDEQDYTTESAEVVGTGDGAITTFNHTLTFKAGNPLNTCFGITVTDGVETLTDDYDGNLVGSAGGTGTINYTTGVMSVTFAVAPLNLASVTTTYQHENSNNNGITDFTKSATRTAGQGFVFRQDTGGGKSQSVLSYNNVLYCLHIKRTWALTIGLDDTTATNLPYRHRVGIPNDRAAVETGEGIYYIDETTENDTRVRLLTYDRSGSQQVIPVAYSNNVNLNNYTFDQGACTLYGDFVLFSGREKSSPINNVTFLYNKLFKTWDMLDYGVTCFEIYNGALVAGDSLSNNFLELFSGLDELDSPIDNNYTTGYQKLLDGLVKSKKFKLRGSIGPDQSIKVSISTDGGPYTEFRSATDIANSTADRQLHFIEGDGSYVDRTNRVTVGPSVLGRKTVGGGGDGIEAYTYEREISFPFDKFELVSVKFEATRVGWASVMLYSYQDLRFKGRKIPRKYRG